MTTPAYSDPELLEWTLTFSKKHNVDIFIETGSYFGDSAKLVSQYFSKVFTVENNVENHRIAKQNLDRIVNCELILGSSPEVIRELELTSNTFFFLDAHWDSYWPLLDELFEIKQKKIFPIIAIHDFFVPDDFGNPLFGYDTYRGHALNFSYIEDSINSIYGKNNYKKIYSTSSITNSGVIYITPIA